MIVYFSNNGQIVQSQPTDALDIVHNDIVIIIRSSGIVVKQKIESEYTVILDIFFNDIIKQNKNGEKQISSSPLDNSTNVTA